MRDYLVLLSICQTCHYKGVSFLKFLLSKEDDVDGFCQRQQHRPRRSAIELYPKGFVPRHLAHHYKQRARHVQSNAALRELEEGSGEPG